MRRKILVGIVVLCLVLDGSLINSVEATEVNQLMLEYEKSPISMHVKIRRENGDI